MVLTSSSFMSFIRLNLTLPTESLDERRYSILSTHRVFSWVWGWFDPSDPLTQRGWHQYESWTNGVVFLRCSKLQPTWCSNQRQSFPFYLCGFWLWKQEHIFIEVFDVMNHINYRCNVDHKNNNHVSDYIIQNVSHPT